MWKIKLKWISKHTVRSVWEANMVVSSTLVYEKKRIYSQAVPNQDIFSRFLIEKLHGKLRSIV
jgi:hypothetical protein